MAVDFSNVFATKVVPSSVRDELDKRANKTFMTGMSGQKTWADVRSMADNSPIALTTYKTFSEAYGSTGRPNILIQSLDIKSHGEYGTLRRANVKLKVFTDDDMNKLAAGYFIPAMSIRIQFGWSLGVGASSQGPITEILEDSQANIKIRERSAATPTYDGFQGRLISWDFSLADDQSWDVNMEIIGAAAAVANISANDEAADCYCEQKSPPAPTDTGEAAEEDEEAKSKTSKLQAALIQLIDDVYAARGRIAQDYKIGFINAVKLKYNGYERDQSGTEDTSSPWYTFGMGDPSIGTEEAYIPFKSLCRLIERTCAQSWQDNHPTLLEIDCDNVEISNYGFSLFSCDPRVCVLQGSQWSLEGGGDTFDGLLGNIYVNCIHVLKLTKNLRDEDDGVIALLNMILKDINNACGNGWEFDIVDTTSADPSNPTKASTRITIIDLNNTTDKGATAYEFKSGVNGKSNVRSVDLSMKPSDAMKTLAMYSNDSDFEQASVASCPDRFIMYGGGAKNLGAPEGGTKGPSSCGGDKCGSDPGGPNPLEAVQEEVNDKHVASAKSYVTQLRAEKNKDACKNAIMPFQLSLSVTGIGGFSFGQLVTLDRLPGALKSKINYQVTAVEHSVTPDDWTTKINTVGRLKP